MPFPTAQGTQACIRAMLDVLAGVGRETHLLAYARGAFEVSGAFTVHRAPGLPVADRFRSGPSPRKAIEDAAMAVTLRRLARRLRPDVFVAHHVEAAAACVAAGTRPWIFVAHTDLRAELPTYVPRTGAVGGAIDRALARRAGAVAAISPALCRSLSAAADRDVSYLPVPWPVPEPITEDERAEARRALDLDAGDEVLLYAGNLDAYQGWEDAAAAAALVAARRPRAKLLVATASSPEPLGTRVAVTALAGEPQRRRVHAAADLALIPRRTPGGLPIKLLDALARGVPVVAASRAAAGLDLRGAAVLVADDDPDALAVGALGILGAKAAARDLARSGTAYVRTDHAPARFVEAFDALCRAARA